MGEGEGERISCLGKMHSSNWRRGSSAVTDRVWQRSGRRRLPTRVWVDWPRRLGVGGLLEEGSQQRELRACD
nr:hypothetical protein Itr_chr06CG05280 [Ipomoea trifida]